MAFLNTQLFTTPTWLLDKEILNKIANPSTSESVANLQIGTLNNLVASSRLYKLNVAANRYGAGKTYTIDELFDDVENGIFSELAAKKSIDGYRRNLQKAYVEDLMALVNPVPVTNVTIGGGGRGGGNVSISSTNLKNTDVPSTARGHLAALRSQIITAAAAATDKATKYHLQDLAERIKKGLKSTDDKE